MSADNYLVLRRRGRWYVLLDGCASTGNEYEVGRWAYLSEAVSAAEARQRDHYYEYGLSLNIESKA